MSSEAAPIAISTLSAIGLLEWLDLVNAPVATSLLTIAIPAPMLIARPPLRKPISFGSGCGRVRITITPASSAG